MDRSPGDRHPLDRHGDRVAVQDVPALLIVLEQEGRILCDLLVRRFGPGCEGLASPNGPRRVQVPERLDRIRSVIAADLLQPLQGRLPSGPVV